MQNWRENWRAPRAEPLSAAFAAGCQVLRTGPLIPRKTALQSYLMYIPEIARAITSCWISAVPSKMS
jgi:hypothetical protein